MVRDLQLPSAPPFARVSRSIVAAGRPQYERLGLVDISLLRLRALVLVANPYAHLIKQLYGPRRFQVRSVESAIPALASGMMRYRTDFKHLLYM